MLLPSGNPFKCHEEVLYFQLLIPPKRFDIFFPLTGGCSEGLGAFRFFFKNIMRDLVNEDVKSWAADLFGAAVAALKASRSPPTDFPDVVVPTWTKLNG